MATHSATAVTDNCDSVSAWAAAWVFGPRLECVQVASYMIALLLHQSGAFDLALPYLRRFRDVRYRLDTELLQPNIIN